MINRSHLLKTLQKPRGTLRRRASTGVGNRPSLEAPGQSPAAAGASTPGVTGRSSFGADERNPLEEVIREIAIMKKMDHPNVVKLYEVRACVCWVGGVCGCWVGSGVWAAGLLGCWAAGLLG